MAILKKLKDRKRKNTKKQLKLNRNVNKETVYGLENARYGKDGMVKPDSVTSGTKKTKTRKDGSVKKTKTKIGGQVTKTKYNKDGSIKKTSTRGPKQKRKKVQFGKTNRDGEYVTGVEKYRKDGTLRKIVSKTKRKNKVNNLRKVEKFDKKGKKRKEVNYFRGKRNTKKM
tara:strand:- start:12027 stop:12536 length:510 start_codon:yes stop_codon:yes gene_type:complete